MHSFTWRQATVLAAVVLTSGCSYVQGFYGSQTTATAPAPVATQASAAIAFLPQPERLYAADISAARAYVSSQRPVHQRMTIVDVRDATEYRLGHPESARHLPYPRMYQACEAHPFGAAQAQVRSDDGGECRYGAVPGSVVAVSALDFFQAVQAALPYNDLPVAVLCRTGACAAEAANLLAQPEKVLGAAYAGKGYREVYVIQEGFVGMPLVARDAVTGRVASSEKKGEKLSADSAKRQAYGMQPLAQDANNDGKITAADYGGWRNFLGLPYGVSMHQNLISETAQPYYELP